MLGTFLSEITSVMKLLRGLRTLTSPEWFDSKDKSFTWPITLTTRDSLIVVGVDPSSLDPNRRQLLGNRGAFLDQIQKSSLTVEAAFDWKYLVRLLSEDIENDRYIEIWNIVLSQFNADPAVRKWVRGELPHKNIDAGAVFLERLVAVIQGAKQTLKQTLYANHPWSRKDVW